MKKNAYYLFFCYLLVLGCNVPKSPNSKIIYPNIVKQYKIEEAYDNMRWLLLVWHIKHLPINDAKNNITNCEKKLFTAIESIDTNCIEVSDISKDTFYFYNKKCFTYISSYSRIIYMFPDYITVDKKSNRLLFQELDVAKIPLQDSLIIENFTDSLRISIFIDFLNKNRLSIPNWLEKEAKEHWLIKK